MISFKSIILTGGPGGGKTTLINEICGELASKERFLVLPEAIFVAGKIGINPREKLFQRLIVETQRGLEDAVYRTLLSDDNRILLCHRGTLDPLAYWLNHGWPEEEFFSFTNTTRDEHYKRYSAVLHLVTAADGARDNYLRWPEAHRPESPEEAIKIDKLLEQAWENHSHYHRIDNAGKDWVAKSHEARQIITQYV